MIVSTCRLMSRFPPRACSPARATVFAGGSSTPGRTPMNENRAPERTNALGSIGLGHRQPTARRLCRRLAKITIRDREVLLEPSPAHGVGPGGTRCFESNSGPFALARCRSLTGGKRPLLRSSGRSANASHGRSASSPASGGRDWSCDRFSAGSRRCFGRASRLGPSRDERSKSVAGPRASLSSVRFSGYMDCDQSRGRPLPHPGNSDRPDRSASIADRSASIARSH